MFRTLLLTASICAALTAPLSAEGSGETIITPDQFEALSTGKTLYFERNGRFFGAEQFYTRRRSLWMNGAKECLDGEWFAKNDLICFDYGTDLDPQCWHFIERSGQYSARAEGESAAFDIHLYDIDNTPLDCQGPAVGA
ncbi:hypothetical protein [Neptunicoccus sediminis]|uniref:hypothetical protein n=1 Tax=Neptunicoccus sediminis TaxID=1892596 RepID=UPI000845EFA9|nr:hypothetical protein [Neptunicoccus sediminis]